MENAGSVCPWNSESIIVLFTFLHLSVVTLKVYIFNAKYINHYIYNEIYGTNS